MFLRKRCTYITKWLEEFLDEGRERLVKAGNQKSYLPEVKEAILRVYREKNRALGREIGWELECMGYH